MKNVNYIINGVLAVAVIILFFLHFSGSKGSDTPQAYANGGDSAVAGLPIAYVNIDSLIQNYNYAKDLFEIQLKKQENARASLGQQMRDLEKEVADFQRKLENKAFMTRERAEQEQQRLVKKQQDLQALDARTADELMGEQQKMNEQLRDSVVNQLKIFNVDRGYQIILSNTGGDNILWAKDAYDITTDFIAYLNKLYSAPAK